MRMLKIIVAGLLMAGGPETLAQNPPEVKWMSVEEALKDPASAHAVKIKAGTDYAYQVQQLAQLPGLKQLYIEVYGLSDLPGGLAALEELEELIVVNQEWFMQPADSFVSNRTEGKFQLAWYTVQKEYRILKVTYIAFDEGLSKDDLAYFTAIFPDAESSQAMHGGPGLLAEVTDPDQLKQLVFAKTYNYVQPPFKGIDVPKSYYAVNAAAGGIFKTASGSAVSIPPMAFVDAAGKPVFGKVSVSYREFRDVADLIACGIPMTYDSGGTVNHFESAGMFELLASQNGKEVFLSKDKKIGIDYASSSASADFNFYSFDDTQGNWSNLGDAGEVRLPGGNGVTPYSEAWSFYKSRVAAYKQVYDSTPFADRFISDNYYYTAPISSEKGAKTMYWTIKDKKKSVLLKIAAVKRTKEGNVVFKLNFYDETHPELRAFSGACWLTDEKMTTSVFRKLFGFKNRFNDIRIEENGTGFTLYLKGIAGVKTLAASMVTLNKNKKEPGELKDGGLSKYKRYRQALAYREKVFNKKLRKGKLRENNTIFLEGDALKAYWWKQAKYRMSPAELAMDMAAWESYVEQLTAQEKNAVLASSPTSGAVVRSLQLSGFGIFNWDKIRRMAKPVSMLVNCVSKAGTKLAGTTIYIVNKGINALFTYGVSQMVSFSEKTDNVMLFVKKDGTLAYCGPEEFSNKKASDKGATFTLIEAGKEIKTVADLRSVIGF
ncbi:MAG: hypothetical protein AB1458_00470 [Bacteroidota bacterium]